MPIGIDELVKSRKTSGFVIPAQAGIQLFQLIIDSRLRGSDVLKAFCETINMIEKPH